MCESFLTWVTRSNRFSFYWLALRFKVSNSDLVGLWAFCSTLSRQRKEFRGDEGFYIQDSFNACTLTTCNFKLLWRHDNGTRLREASAKNMLDSTSTESNRNRWILSHTKCCKDCPLWKKNTAPVNERNHIIKFEKNSLGKKVRVLTSFSSFSPKGHGTLQPLVSYQARRWCGRQMTFVCQIYWSVSTIWRFDIFICFGCDKSLDWLMMYKCSCLWSNANCSERSLHSY